MIEAGISYLASQLTKNWRKLQGLPVLQAHRGWCVDGAKENSLEAIAAARDKGFSMVEFDVRLTRDGEVFLFHDEDLSAACGLRTRVDEMLSADLRKLCPSVCSLKTLLACKDIPDYLNIELKAPLGGRSGLEERVADLIKTSDFRGQILISSFNPYALVRIRKFLPEVPLALLLGRPAGISSSFVLLHDLLAALPAMPGYLHLEQGTLDPQHWRLVKQLGLEVAIWTVNDKTRAKEYLELGASSIITDLILPDQL
ncbi:MAG: glycerophosphodiester phosphodiesterase [Bdellovibrionaceae bacterium]|nr:glycerophosphodiester phosphodiesterase [Pseudobdellovibrionaceae bacterium]